MIRGHEVEDLCFKAEQMSMQKETKSYGVKGKELVIKEIRNIAKKNDCFGEIHRASLTEEIKKELYHC